MINNTEKMVLQKACVDTVCEAWRGRGGRERERERGVKQIGLVGARAL